MNKQTLIRRVAPIGAALALGGGAGAAIYAGTTGGSQAKTVSVVASVPAQPAAVTSTTSSLTQLYKNVTPGVVDITVDSSTPGQFGGTQQSEAEGSGFEIDSNGDILTNEHVIAGATSIKVLFKDGTTAKATLVGSDPSTDVAVVKVNVDASKLHPLTLGDSSTVEPGLAVVAIGSPFGLPESMTAGIVSAVDRTITAPNNYSIAGAIQTDAAINHGNSGGPLLTTNGTVIGIDAQIDSDSGGNDGVGFAIPINAAKSVANTLIAGGKVEHAYLGIKVGDSTNPTGAQVSSVISGSPADKSGLKAGDVITKIDDKSIAGADDLTAVVNSHQPGDAVTVTVSRNGNSLTLHVTLGTRPS